jgi:environmental stress-induced protein Ves
VSILRAAAVPVTPWKNGMGRTRELAIHPAGAGLADFLWRVSVAEVDRAAPFSAFPGVDRQIALLEGDGFVMRFGDGREHALLEPFMPYAFAGEQAVDVVLAGSPTRDFNLMLRRGAATGAIEAWRAGTHDLERVVLVHAARGDVETPEGMLHPGDTWLVPTERMQGRLALRGDAVVLAVRIDATDA